MTPTGFVDSILSACDPSNWDSALNKGAYYRGLHDAYTAIHEIAGDYQTAMYEWTRARGVAQGSPDRDEIAKPQERTYTLAEVSDTVERVIRKMLDDGQIVASSVSSTDDRSAT